MQNRAFIIVFAISCVLLSVLNTYEQDTVWAVSLEEQPVAYFINHGVFDPQQISEDELYQIIEKAYHQETEPEKLDMLGKRLLTLKWWKLWETNFEMPLETIVVGDPLEKHFRPSDTWQWIEPPSAPPLEKGGRVHYSVPVDGLAQHSVEGVFPYILPVNGTLIQHVYLPDHNIPDQIVLRIKTGFLVENQQRPVFVQARWSKRPEYHVPTENRPQNFWAGIIPSAESPSENREGGWHLLSVNLGDIGLCGNTRIIQGIEYHVIGGEAWFGQTLIRRPPVEIRGTRQYHVFSIGDEMAFDIFVHNVSRFDEQYTLDVIVSDYNGTEIVNSTYRLDIPSKSTKREKLVLHPKNHRYFVFEYTLRKNDIPLYHGYNAAAVIVPNRTGRQKDSKFGMMYWIQPGKEIVKLYEQLGVKLMVIFPELPRLHLFDSRKFEIMPMLWSLPEQSPQQATKLEQDIRPYIEADQHTFSNFWETDLRVPADIFAVNMRRFYQIVKQMDPAASIGIGGLAWFNVAYLTQLLQSSSESFFDFIAVMLYNTPSPPEFSGIDQEATALTSLLETYGRPETGIWNVEWSYFDSLNLDRGDWLNAGVPREFIAPYTIRHHLLGFASGITKMLPGVNLYVGRTPLAKNYGHGMNRYKRSFTRYDLTPLPLFPAYSVMTRMLEGKEYSKTLGQNPNIICQVYRATDERYKSLLSSPTVLSLWSLFGAEDLAIPLLNQNEGDESDITLLTMVGDETIQSTYNGALHLSISPEPTYILLDGKTEKLVNTSEVFFTEPLLSGKPKTIEIPPESPSTVKLMYHLYNPGWKALQGTLKLISPNWIDVVDREIHYQNETAQKLASAILANLETQPASDPKSCEIWLGRQHAIDVTFEVHIPEHIRRNAHYEQIALTHQSAFSITAVFERKGNVIARTITDVRELPPLSMTMRPLLVTKYDINTPRLLVRLTNHTPKPRQGTLYLKIPSQLQIDPQKVSFSLTSRQTKEFTFFLKGRVLETGLSTIETVDTQLNRRSKQVGNQGELLLEHYRRKDGYLFSFGIGEGFIVEALVHDQQGYETRQIRGFAFRPAVKTNVPIVIDGQLNDWGEASPLFINPEERLSGLTFFANDYGKPLQWNGIDDFSAAWQMMWDESSLYLAVRTFDDQFVPQHSLGSFWNGDTISFQIDPTPDLTDASIIPAQRNLLDIHTFDCGLSKEGPVVRRKYATREKPAGLVKTINTSIKQIQSGIIYELAIPWDELTPLRPAIGNWMGFSLVFYEDDGFGRETRCNWFGGAGGNGLAREPRLMGDIYFVR
jgi:hypothetical protein